MFDFCMFELYNFMQNALENFSEQNVTCKKAAIIVAGIQFPIPACSIGTI